MTLTIAHLSDVHLPAIPAMTLRQLHLKRSLGLLNWRRNRRGLHRMEVIEALVADMARHQPDHIAVTGDLCNIGLPEEHVAALAWLRSLGPPDRVSVVPGNHDIYVKMRDDPGVGRWQAYMDSDAFGAGLTKGQAGFPYVRRVGGIALVGLNSGVPTPPFVAAGRLGGRQRARLAEILQALGRLGLVRVVLIHHPPLPGQAKRLRALADAEKLAPILQRHGVEIVLHGHNHRNMHAQVTWAGGIGAIIGVPSFSAGEEHGDEPPARYNLLRFAGGAVEIVGRGLDGAGSGIVELERRRIELRAAQGGPGA